MNKEVLEKPVVTNWDKVKEEIVRIDTKEVAHDGNPLCNVIRQVRNEKDCNDRSCRECKEWLKQPYKEDSKDEKDVLQKAIDTYGEEAQQDMAIEEALELALAILKHRRAKRENSTEEYIARRKNNIIEESADVKVMIKQLEMMFDCKEEVQEQMKFKVDRLKKRMEG